MFSKACEYGIRALIYISNRSLQNERASLKDIAAEIDSPESFTAKILQQLSRTEILESVKGPTGGFKISPEKSAKITLIDIVATIDGDKIFHGCGLGLKECNAKKPCPMHNHFMEVRNDLKTMLSSTTLLDLVKGLDSGDTFLKR